MQSFSPVVVSRLIVEPLRYFFTHYAKAYDLVWDRDEKVRTIEIGESTDFHKIAIQKNPRILISRGDYGINKTALTDNMAERIEPQPNIHNGMDDRINMVFINGSAQIIIEARQKGTCELLTDMVSHFIVWSRPLLCDTQGFKEFGLPMNISDCMPDKESTDKFRVVINIPYLMEEKWTVRQDALALKDFFINLSK